LKGKIANNNNNKNPWNSLNNIWFSLLTFFYMKVKILKRFETIPKLQNLTQLYVNGFDNVHKNCQDFKSFDVAISF
jgi:hypothetical protein